MIILKKTLQNSLFYFLAIGLLMYPIYIFADKVHESGTTESFRKLVEQALADAEILEKENKTKKAINILENAVPDAYAAKDELLLETVYLRLLEAYTKIKHKKKTEEYSKLYELAKTSRKNKELEQTNKQKDAMLNKLSESNKQVKKEIELTEKELIQMNTELTGKNSELNQVRDSLNIMDLINREKEAQISILNKQKEIEALKFKEQELLLKEQEAAQKLNNMIIIFLISGLVALSALALFIYKIFRQKKTYSEQIENQLEIISHQHENIKKSINYAQRIQNAMLLNENTVQSILSDSFIFFKPRDVVSGDFYWFHDINGNDGQKILVAAVDCTGHGVPGAFMSMIGCNILNEIANRKIYEPDLILYELNKSIRKALKQDENNIQDGMDISLCLIDKQRKIIEFAGAKNPILVIKENKMELYKGDKNPIGGYQGDEDRTYTKNIIPLDSPTTIYFFSDGYIDQFGGPENKKFMSKNLRDLLFNIHKEPFNNQKTILEQTLENWKGKTKVQIDDILVMGMKVS